LGMGCAAPFLLALILAVAASINEAVGIGLALLCVVSMSGAILLLRDAYIKTKLDRRDLKNGKARIFQLQEETIEEAEEDYLGEDGEFTAATSLAITSSERIISSDGVLPAEAVPLWSPIASVAPTYDQGSLVRELSKEEQAEIRARIRKGRAWPVLALLATGWWLLGLLSLIRGTFEFSFVVPWCMAAYLSFVLWKLYLQTSDFNAQLKQDLASNKVVRDDDVELLYESRLPWTIKGVPAPWRRVGR
jgi:hypothetical protein